MPAQTILQRGYARTETTRAILHLVAFAGGPTEFQDTHFGWGEIVDEAIGAIHVARDAGTAFFNTDNSYGTAHSERIIPIPGLKTVAQVRENVGVLPYGPLSSQ